MAEKTNETATAEKKAPAKKSSSKSGSKSGSKSTNSRSAASRNSSARSNSGRGGNRNSGGGRGRSASSKVNKVYKQSPIAIVCYALAAAMVLYACFTAGNTVKQINEYYSAYGMSASAKDFVTYVAPAMLEPLIHAFTFFMAGYILTAVRKLDPKNYVAEKAAKKPEVKQEAKKEDKTVEFKKQEEKTEAKAEKAAAETKKAAFEAKSTKEEFEESLEAELKKEEEKA